MSGHKISLIEATHSLKESNREFKVLFERGSLSVELYRPDRVDKQKPHDRDEIYVIAIGSGKFELDGTSMAVTDGDFLFVPAGVHHRFFEFSEDFTVWVFFYGPSGGEHV
ncbi:cupin domain-containing protein [bacterium]|nr:cupin domain-containing protein [bacterium]